MSYRSKQEVSSALQRAASRYVERAVEIAADIMEDPDYKAADRLTAIKFIADRAAGKASQELIIDVPDTDELEQRMEIAQRQTREVLMLPPPVAQPLDNIIPIRPKKKRVKVT
jgi:hypothetical protein